MGWLFHLLAVAAVSSAPATDEQQEKIAVLDVQTKHIDADTGAVFSEILTTEVHELGRFSVISGSDLRAMLGLEGDKQRLGCEDDSCMAEIGGALGVDLLLGSQIGKVGDTYVVNIKLIDVRKAQVVDRVYERVDGQLDEVLDSIRTSVARLFSPKPSAGGVPGVAASADDRFLSVGVPPVALWGAGAVSLGVATYFGVRARDRYDYATDETKSDRQAAIAEGKTAQLVANILFAVGAVSVAGGTLWALLGGDDDEALSLSPLVGQRTKGVALTVGW